MVVTWVRLSSLEAMARTSTHVETVEIAPVSIECRVVEVGELLCDGVDVGHGEDKEEERNKDGWTEKRSDALHYPLR